MASVILKGLSALLESVGGILLLFTGAVSSIISFLIKKELIEDPSDFLANYIQRLIPSTHSELFGAFYLLSHGIIKVFLVIGLLRNKAWAYPATIIFIALLIIYQIYKFIYTHSPFLFLLTLFDTALVLLTWHEYKFMKKYRPLSS